jgi:hypothetical protein
MKSILIIDYSTVRGHHAYYIKGAIDSFIHPDHRVLVCTVDNQEFHSIIGRINHFQFRDLPFPIEVKIFSRMLKWFNLSDFQSIVFLIRLRYLINRDKVEFVFFPHLDSVISFDLPTFVWKLIPVRWSGILIRPFNDQRDYSYRLNKISDIVKKSRASKFLILDEILFSQISPAREKIEPIPELLGYTEVDTIYSRKLQDLKANRISIAIIGSLLRRKNLLSFLKLCERLDASLFFVYVVGLIPDDQYTNEERQRINAHFKSLAAKGMLYLQLGYIEKESHFNAVYASSDVVWLNYEDHPYTSNAIIKAIHFKSRVITNRTCTYVQRVVQRYHFPFLNFEEITDMMFFYRWSIQPIDKFNSDAFYSDFSFAVFEERVRGSC